MGNCRSGPSSASISTAVVEVRPRAPLQAIADELATAGFLNANGRVFCDCLGQLNASEATRAVAIPVRGPLRFLPAEIRHDSADGDLKTFRTKMLLRALRTRKTPGTNTRDTSFAHMNWLDILLILGAFVALTLVLALAVWTVPVANKHNAHDRDAPTSHQRAAL